MAQSDSTKVSQVEVVKVDAIRYQPSQNCVDCVDEPGIFTKESMIQCRCTRKLCYASYLKVIQRCLEMDKKSNDQILSRNKVNEEKKEKERRKRGSKNKEKR